MNCRVGEWLKAAAAKHIINVGKINAVVQAKKQPWSASLCHSLVPHTNVELSLRFVKAV